MDIITYLRSRGIKMVSRDDGVRDKHIGRGWYQCVCPVCGGKHLWLGYNVKGDFFNCYNHGHSSKWELFKAWFPNENIAEIFTFLDEPATIQRQQKEVEKVKGRYLPPAPLHPLFQSPKHIEYIRERNLDPFILAKKWGVWALDEDADEFQYRNRVFIPVCDDNSNPVSWLTRTIEPDNPYRYLTAPQEREISPIKDNLFGQQFVTPFDTVIVVEGVFDAFAVGKNVVATLGKKVTEKQIELISRYQRRIICFDSEPETQEQARELAENLDIYPGITQNVCLDAPDPGSASKKEIEKLLKFAELI